MCRESSYSLSHALEDLPAPYGKKRPRRKTCLLKLPRLLSRLTNNTRDNDNCNGNGNDNGEEEEEEEEQAFRELYQSRARELLDHCPRSWRDNDTPDRRPSVFRGYLEAYASAGTAAALGLGPENEAYIRRAVDTYCACLQRADEMVAAAGLRRPPGARSCEMWDEALAPGQRAAWRGKGTRTRAGAGEDEEEATPAEVFLGMGTRLSPRLCSLRMQDRPYFAKPLQYVTMCIWETTGRNAAHREDMLMQVEAADGRILRRCLLGDHERWYPACGCLDGGETEAFRAFYHDNRRGSHRVVPRSAPPPYRADGY